MIFYFKQTTSKGFSRKPRLPARLDEALVILENKAEHLREHSYNTILRLTIITDLKELKDKSADRTE